MSAEIDIAQYWPFAALCAFTLATVIRLLLRESIALQGSLSYLAFLSVFLLAALLPHRALELARAMGFTLLSNFLFAVALMGLSVLHLRVLVSLSRTEQRTLDLTQELGLLEERLRSSAREP